MNIDKILKDALNIYHYGSFVYGTFQKKISDNDYIVEKGDKISQLVIMPILTPSLELVDKLSETDRGNGGFGSTGR